MDRHAGTGRTYYEGIGIDKALMAANDVICQGAFWVIYPDELAAGAAGNPQDFFCLFKVKTMKNNRLKPPSPGRIPGRSYEGAEVSRQQRSAG